MTEPDPTRRCSRCRLSLPLAAFTPRGSSYRSRCRSCALEETKASQARHRDELAERRRIRYHAARATGASAVEASRAAHRRAT